MRRGKKIAAALTAVLALGMFSGCGQIDADAVAVTVAEGEDTVTLGYANFVAKYTQAVYETTYGSSLGEDMWNQDLYGNGNTFEEDVKNDVMDSLQEQYLLVNHASDYGVELTEEDTADAQASVYYLTALSGLGEAAWKKEDYKQALSCYEKAAGKSFTLSGASEGTKLFWKNCAAACAALKDPEKEAHYRALADGAPADAGGNAS